ncbi:MAG: extracellular solute-binding protein [Oscillospiraceae bacterium]|nr:extracellular solute-binding protein [Oscillospiraceae bacterium]
MAKKLFALALVVLMVFTLVGCGKSNKREIIKLTLSTEDSEAILAAAGITLPDAETTLASGSTIKWHSWYDDFHNYSEDEIVNTGYWTFQEKYGCEIEWIETTYGSRFDDLANLVLGGTSPDFTSCSVTTFPYQCIKGMFQPVTDYIDYTDALWAGSKDFVDNYFSMGGEPYIILVDVKATNVVAYNRRVVEEWGFDDPAELYYNDEWTWDIFYEMCVDFSDGDEDRYALDGWYWQQALVDSAGTTIIEIEDGQFKSNIDDPVLEAVQTLIYDLNKNETNYPMWSKGYTPRNDTVGAGIKEGLCLFYLVEKWGFTDTVETINSIWGDIEAGEVMFAPLPRNADGDGTYYLASQPVGYHIITGAENAEAVVLFSMCERFKILDPTVISIDIKQLKETYKWTDEMLEMNDVCYKLAAANPIVNFASGCQPNLSTAVSNCIGGTAGNNPSSWAQLKEQYKETIDYYVEELNSLFQESLTE